MSGHLPRPLPLPDASKKKKPGLWCRSSDTLVFIGQHGRRVPNFGIGKGLDED